MSVADKINGCMDQDVTWYEARTRPRRLCGRWGHGSPPQKVGGSPPQFSAHVHSGQTAGWIKMAHGIEVGLGPDRIVLNSDSSPLPKKGAKPPSQFSAHFCCGQTAGCIKMSLGMEVGLSPGDFVFNGDPAPSPKRGQSPPNFRPISLAPNGCMDQDATWYRGRPHHNVWPMSIVAKRLDGSRWHLA